MHKSGFVVFIPWHQELFTSSFALVGTRFYFHVALFLTIRVKKTTCEPSRSLSPLSRYRCLYLSILTPSPLLKYFTYVLTSGPDCHCLTTYNGLRKAPIRAVFWSMFAMLQYRASVWSICYIRESGKNRKCPSLFISHVCIKQGKWAWLTCSCINT